MTTVTLLAKDLLVAVATTVVASLTANVPLFSAATAITFGLALVIMAVYEWPWQVEQQTSTRTSQMVLALIMATVLTMAILQTAPRGVTGTRLLWTFLLVFLAVLVLLALTERFQEMTQSSPIGDNVPAPAADDLRLTLMAEMEETFPTKDAQVLTDNTPDQRGVCPGQPALPQQATAPLTAGMADVAGDLCYHCPYKVRPGLDCVATLGAGYNENVAPYSFDRYIA